jgi:hypothetical protein
MNKLTKTDLELLPAAVVDLEAALSKERSLVERRGSILMGEGVTTEVMVACDAENEIKLLEHGIKIS